MGLKIIVGVLAEFSGTDEDEVAFFQRQIELLNNTFAIYKLPKHVEPTNIPRFQYESSGIYDLECLRRIAAHLIVNQTLPDPCNGDPIDDPLLRDMKNPITILKSPWLDRFGEFRHLLCHKGNDGFFIPVDTEPRIDLQDDGLIGESIGSSNRLLKECENLAKRLNVPDDIEVNDDRFIPTGGNGEKGTGWERYSVEASTCVALIAAARHSLTHNAAIFFC